MCKLAWRFLKQVVKENRVNESALAIPEYTRFMSSQLGTNFNVVDTYKELYSGNWRLLCSIKNESVEGKHLQNLAFPRQLRGEP